MNRNQAEKFKLPIPLLLGASIFILLGLSVYSIFLLQELNIDNDVQTTLNNTHRLFHGQLYKEATFLRNLIVLHQEDEDLQQAFVARDRQKLLALATPLLENFAGMDGVSHFYFHDLDRKCFARVHHPRSYGDEITRYTLEAAVRDGKTSYGIELGPYGAFTLRVVQPWLINGELAGYIELGKEIDHITPTLKKVMDIDLIFAVRKEFLNRQRLEEAMVSRITPVRKIDWDQFPDHVMIDSTLGDAPALISRELLQRHTEHGKSVIELEIGNRHFRGGFTPLLEVSGRDVGDFIILKDTTEAQAIRQRVTGIIMILFAVVCIVLLGLIYYFIHEFEKRLKDIDGGRPENEADF